LEETKDRNSPGSSGEEVKSKLDNYAAFIEATPSYVTREALNPEVIALTNESELLKSVKRSSPCHFTGFSTALETILRLLPDNGQSGSYSGT
jgi:hypothetical protein